MKERHSHEEAAIRRATKIPVRAADPLTKAQRDIIEREKADTDLADSWIRDNGGWQGQPVHDDGDGAFVISGEDRPCDDGSEED